MLRSFAAMRRARSMCRRAIVIPLNEARAGRSALTKHDRRDREKSSRELDVYPWTFNSTYRLIGLIWRQLTGQAYRYAFSAACTDDYQVNDLTAVLSTQRILQIGNVARTRAVDSND
jgi:hypothetical protein